MCGRDLITLSVGMAFCPDDGYDVERLLAEADRRMYSMKQIHHAERRARARRKVARRDGEIGADSPCWRRKIARHGLAMVATVLLGGLLSATLVRLAPGFDVG